MIDNMRPLSDFIVVNRIEKKEEKTENGIILSNGSGEKVSTGKVIAVGNGKWTDMGHLIPLSVKVGDKIVFRKYGGTEFHNNLMVLQERDVLGVVNDNNKTGL